MRFIILLIFLLLFLIACSSSYRSSRRPDTTSSDTMSTTSSDRADGVDAIDGLDATDGADSVNGLEETDSANTAVTFSGGIFALETFEVDDTCLDGGLDLVFMPEGTEQPYQLAENNELPAESALPSNQTIKLQSPFDAMTVEITSAGSGAMTIKDAKQQDVVVDDSQWGQCKADMVIDADITVIDDDNVTVAASVTVATWNDGPTAGDACPDAKNACVVTLSMRGSRVQ